MVRIHPDPPPQLRGQASARQSRASAGAAARGEAGSGAVAQLGERLLCKQEAVGSIPSSSTIEESAVRGQKSEVRGQKSVTARLGGRLKSIDCANRQQSTLVIGVQSQALNAVAL
jgi:hypothetical protein